MFVSQLCLFWLPLLIVCFQPPKVDQTKTMQLGNQQIHLLLVLFCTTCSVRITKQSIVAPQEWCCQEFPFCPRFSLWRRGKWKHQFLVHKLLVPLWWRYFKSFIPIPSLPGYRETSSVWILAATWRQSSSRHQQLFLKSFVPTELFGATTVWWPHQEWLIIWTCL